MTVAGVSTTISDSIATSSLSLMRIGCLTRPPAIVSCNSAPVLRSRKFSAAPQFSAPISHWCSASASFAIQNKLVRDAAVSVSCSRRSISYGVSKKGSSLGLRNRRRDSLALPGLRGSLQSPSEPGSEQAEEASSSATSNPERSGSGPSADGKRWSKPSPAAKELNKAVRKTAATFAPRASTASKNPAPPGSTLYTVFEAQAYAAMALGGALSFNLVFPSDHPDIWRLMGMWSVWMFTVPSLRARDCSKKEKEALNYLFLLIPLVNVTLPLLWRSFEAVWSADVVAFFAIYAWKMGWLSRTDEIEDS